MVKRIIYASPFFEYYSFCYDIRGSVTIVTDETGDVSGEYMYSTYGKRITLSGDAPRGIDRVDKPHTEDGLPHIHFGENDKALNIDGTWHDKGKNMPTITNAIKKWILKNGWRLPK